MTRIVVHQFSPTPIEVPDRIARRIRRYEREARRLTEVLTNLSRISPRGRELTMRAEQKRQANLQDR